MKKNTPSILTSILSFVLLISYSTKVSAQINSSPQSKSPFWDKVQIGGGLGLGFGNGYTNVSIAPSGIYNFNDYVSAGVGLQYGYVNQKYFYQSHIYGGSIIALINPIKYLQISTELEQLRVNSTFDTNSGKLNDDFWNTALFIGAGYRTNNVTLGIRYNLLHNNNNNVYADAFMPFIRVYF
jgi:hypothetical protein